MVHVENVKIAREKLMSQGQALANPRDDRLYHDLLNFDLPHTYGGFGHPVDLEHVNLFTEEEELPLIKPHTV